MIKTVDLLARSNQALVALAVVVLAAQLGCLLAVADILAAVEVGAAVLADRSTKATFPGILAHSFWALALCRV